jgi:signal transduction histidine kinase
LHSVVQESLRQAARSSARGSIRVVREDDFAVVCGEDATFASPRYGALVHPYFARVKAHAVEALVGAFAVASIIEVFVVHDVENRLLAAVLALGWSLPFLLRSRNPLLPPVIVTIALVTLGLVEGKSTENLSMPFLGALAAAVSFGALADRRQQIAGWCAIVGAAAIVDYRSSNTAADFFWTTLIFSLAWVFGAALGNRTAQTRELRQRVAAAELDGAAAAERAAADERARITHELHDVVAHSISVMVVQASGVRRLLRDDQEREREALLSVERIGREALGEMRRMLGVMKADEQPTAAALAPQPGLQHLDRLIEQVEKAGLPVQLRVEGPPTDLPAGIDLSAYRIVQEGLTNALKYARGAHAEVIVRYVDDGVELEVADDGPGANGAELDGQGLAGMRERVAVFGGTLDAGPREGGGFVLRAQLPVEARS